MSWIRDKLLGLRAVFFGGEQLPERGALEFAGDGVEVEDDPINKRTRVTVSGGGAEGDVDPNPNTILQRGADGEGRMSRVVAEELITWVKTKDAAANTQMLYELPVAPPRSHRWTVSEVYFIPAESLEPDDTNYAILGVHIYSLETGDYIETIAVAETKETGPNATGYWLAHRKVQLTLQSGALLGPAQDTEYLAVTLLKAGSGVVVPAGLLVIVQQPWEEE
ncbi:hypothetical protein WME98_49940 [Sorangium sp. So ce296]|uniref:hypothetical protein n=1 Tax=Sorangium sp. So ce296 TaxID=3133296 RepID=UPI003F60A637